MDFSLTMKRTGIIMKINTLTQAREEIEEVIREHGPYSIDIIACVLRMVATRWGFGDANKLIEDFKLTKRYGIHKRQE